MDDRHASARDKKRRKLRYGPTTTNPGMRVVMRDLARKAREEPGPEPSRDEADEADELRRAKRKHRTSHRHGIGDKHSDKGKS